MYKNSTKYNQVPKVGEHYKIQYKQSTTYKYKWALLREAGGQA